MSDVARLVEAHRLEPHPEGGWYRRTWTAPEVVAMPHGERHTASAILFLLDRDEVAAWHVVRSDELWLWHGPGTLEVTLGGTGERPEEAEPIVLDASSPQLLVPAGAWQRTIARGAHALASCVVSPEFRFDDWRLAES